MAIVLGYHGCSKEAARRLLGGSSFVPSNKSYDWLGEGSYFWEDDVQRAYEWALERRGASPCAVGAVIELGNCLDLTKRKGIEIVRLAHESYLELQAQRGELVPVNQPVKGGRPENLVLRNLDRAVIDHLHSMYKLESQRDAGRTKEFDTVRAMFPEGKPVYDTAGFFERTHVQIAVRNPEQIFGVFRIPTHQLHTLSLPPLYDF